MSCLPANLTKDCSSFGFRDRQYPERDRKAIAREKKQKRTGFENGKTVPSDRMHP